MIFIDYFSCFVIKARYNSKHYQMMFAFNSLNYFMDSGIPAIGSCDSQSNCRTSFYIAFCLSF